MPVDPSSEIDTIYREEEELRHNGASDDVVIVHLEKRMQDFTARLDKEHAERLAEIKAKHAHSNGAVVPKRYRIPAIIAMLIIITGDILEMTIGKRFVFSAADQYRAMIPWLLVILVPAFAWMWFNLEHASHSIADRYPAWWVRWLLAFPLIVALSSAIVAIFPLGWFALYGFLYGIPDGDIEAKMLAVSPHHPNSRGCNQNADIIINGNSARICLAQALSGSAPAAGEAVTVTGRVSGVGVFIDELRTKQ